MITERKIQVAIDRAASVYTCDGCGAEIVQQRHYDRSGTPAGWYELRVALGHPETGYSFNGPYYHGGSAHACSSKCLLGLAPLALERQATADAKALAEYVERERPNAEERSREEAEEGSSGESEA